MKRFYSIFFAMSLISSCLIAVPQTVTVSAGLNVQPGQRLSIEWMHRVSQGVYVYSPMYYMNFQSSISVPQFFQANSSFSAQYETEGFRLTLNGDISKRSQILFPFNDNKNIAYTYQIIGNIVDSDNNNNSACPSSI